LWLATLARDHEFTFLDHALKSGDSLVGLTQAQIEAAHWDTSKPGLPLFRQLVKDRVAEAMKGRAEIQAAPDDTARAVQEQRHRSLEAQLEDIRLIGDAVIAAFFAEDRPKAREKKRAEVESWLGGSPAAWDKLASMAATLKLGAHPLPPFHWEVEFPEVFARENGGFDAIVGNPPFLGGKSISTNFGDAYSFWLEALHGGSRSADLVGHFFRRAFELVRSTGVFGLIATKTIRQGDTRETSLLPILISGGAIRNATRRLQWPGEATVVVSVVHITKSRENLQPILDTRPVSRISAYLVEGAYDHSPARLSANARRAFQGSILLGMGFTFDDEAASKGEAESIATMKALIQNDAKNGDRIFPYIGGEEVNNDPRHANRRFTIDFFDRPLRRDKGLKSWASMKDNERARCRTRGVVPSDYPGGVAEDWPDLLNIVRQRVKPERDRQKRPALRDRWWQYADKRPGLYAVIAALPNVLVINCGACPHMGFAQLAARSVFANTLDVFAFDTLSPFAVLQSRSHEVWTRFFGSTFEDRLRYTPSDCFETFVLPGGFDTSSALDEAGQVYHDHRAALMVDRNEGMTKTYNRFHDQTETADDIQRLRKLHVDMDRAVLEAYGWHDLAERAVPIFLDETNEDDHTYQGRLFWPSDFRDEVLARLLALNAERHAEEVRLGIAPGMRTREDEVELEDD
jgi:hypothetical protein